MSFWALATDEKSAPVAVAVARSRRRVIKSGEAPYSDIRKTPEEFAAEGSPTVSRWLDILKLVETGLWFTP